MISDDFPISEPAWSVEDHEAEIARRDREIRSLNLLIAKLLAGFGVVFLLLSWMLFRR